MNVLNKPTEISVKHLINRTSVKLIFSLFALQRADALGSRFPQIRLDQINGVEKQTIDIIESKAPLSIKELAINGKDLMRKFSIKPGIELGIMLKYLLEIVLENSEFNTKEKLLSIIYDKYYKN